MKLEISLFKFDKNSDYLPYYTKHFIKISNEQTILDLLKTCDVEENLSYKDNADFDLVVNGVFVKGSHLIVDIVKTVGKDLTIDPISIRRAIDDLIIDDSDFQEKLSFIEEFLSDEHTKQYQSLKHYYYASETLNHEYNYIGDSVLILAANLIKENKSIESELLQKLSSHETGAQFHTSLENRILHLDPQIQEDIIHLQKKLGIYKEIQEQNFKQEKTLILDFGIFHDNYEVKHDFKNFNIAYYSTNKDEKHIELIEKLNCKLVNYEADNLPLAKNTFEANPTITNKVATKIILDAFDQNADFLLVDNDSEFYIFDYTRKQMTKIAGRDVLLPVIHINELQKLASGEHNIAKKTLALHAIDPEIV
jgi:succinate dehydrogenase/fumarate reductase-like Fe-S protein